MQIDANGLILRLVSQFEIEGACECETLLGRLKTGGSQHPVNSREILFVYQQIEIFELSQSGILVISGE